MRRDVELDGEHPDVIIADILRRPRPKARIIVVANEKGGVGKSTIAFHLCVALAERGHAVAAVDLDRRQQTLARVLSNREATARRLGIRLPGPAFQVLNFPTGAMLCQEINRIGSACDCIVIDVAGHDSRIARRAIALADTLITPVNSSFVDLDLLGRLHPVTLDPVSRGCFAVAVDEIRQARVKHGLPGLDWVVTPNRLRPSNSLNQSRIETALQRLADCTGFRVASGFSERVAYRELFLMGLTYMDIRRIPELRSARLRGADEVSRLIDELALALVEHRPQVPAAKGAALPASPHGLSLGAPVLELREEWLEAANDRVH